MTRLVHLNGPPGIGKSTLARRYVDDHPLAFCLDIDMIRGQIGRWDERPEESGQLARKMALAMARQHLSSGYDVIVPQFVAKAEFVHQLSDAASGLSASFWEIVLMDEPAGALARFESRADDPRWSTHHTQAVRQIEASGGFMTMYDRLADNLDNLPSVVRLMTSAGEINTAYQSLLAALRDGDS